jgi:hypothetical protein
MEAMIDDSVIMKLVPLAQGWGGKENGLDIVSCFDKKVC